MSVNNDFTAQQTRQDQHSQDDNGVLTNLSDASDLSDSTDMPDMSEMQRLLDEQEAQFKSIKRGDVVEGQIVRIDADEILVDIGLKSEGVLGTRELPQSGYGSLSELHVGDNVLVYVMQPETPEGHAIVSIKRARLERQWRIAQEQYERGDLLEAEVIDHNKGGLIVNLEGIRGFVPISQILNLKREDTADNVETQTKLQNMVGRKLQLKIIEINRNRNRLILSERLAVQEWRAKRREELLNELQVGEVRKGVVSNLSNFGAFVDLGGADGLVHISQLAWSRVNHPSEVLKVGQEVEVQVLSVDKEKKKIALSIKRAEIDPWTTVEQRYQIGQVVKGTVTKIAPFGAFARIEDGVEGLIHLSELPAGQQDPKAVLKEGQEVNVRILRIDPERRRLGLSIRQVEQTDEESAAHAETGETPATPPQAAVSAQEPVEGRADVANAATREAATAATPALNGRGPSTARPAPEEAPTTAMAEAFRTAQLNRQREQVAPSAAAEASGETPVAEAVAEAAAEVTAEVTPEVTPEATTETAPAAEATAEAGAPAPASDEATTSAAPAPATSEVEETAPAAESAATGTPAPANAVATEPATNVTDGASNEEPSSEASVAPAEEVTPTSKES
ncbi:MAG: 30S ribosomal protein S1 [Ktedonobacterales bacterium]